MPALAFDTELATSYGVNEAIFINNVQYWVRHNKYNKSQAHYYEGKYWTWNTQEALTKLFPFWSLRTIQRIISSLVEQKLIITCQPNKTKHDHTTWYTLSNEMWCFFDGDKLSHSIRQNDKIDTATLSCSDSDKMASSDTAILSHSYNNIDNNKNNSIDNVFISSSIKDGDKNVLSNLNEFAVTNQTQQQNLQLMADNAFANWKMLAKEMGIEFTQDEWGAIGQYVETKLNLPIHLIRTQLILLNKWAYDGLNIEESLLRSCTTKTLVQPIMTKIYDKQRNRIYDVVKIVKLRQRQIEREKLQKVEVM